ncbi:MAG: hypothetical protein FRX48_08081 [Lasallia pustulata]|uniref:Uncharacterized protein n=1 Tax=Lasallia pustulata TaxID=136370 RepID=A0A5M8PG55_9LECA|nr:MAG: hypothetical protein FRX48_08081 [Lasallia pustulata]
MSTFRLFLSFLLSLSTRLSIALPTSSSAFSPLTPRTLYCANAPTVQAGSLFSRALPLPHPPSKRNPAYPYCAQNTRTYIVGTLFAPYLPWTSPASVAVADLLIDAEKFVTHHLQTEGDGLLAGGRFDWPGGHNLMLRAWNANNHQLTERVVQVGGVREGVLGIREKDL